MKSPTERDTFGLTLLMTLYCQLFLVEEDFLPFPSNSHDCVFETVGSYKMLLRRIFSFYEEIDRKHSFIILFIYLFFFFIIKNAKFIAFSDKLVLYRSDSVLDAHRIIGKKCTGLVG